MYNKYPYTQNNIQIFNGDFLKLENIPINSIDLIVTSPPYNIGMEYSTYNDSISYADYLSFTENWLSKALMLSKDDGRLCINIPIDKSNRRS